MKVNIIFGLTLVGILYFVFGEDTLNYRIEVSKDTIFFGEPIIIRCKLTNESDKKIGIIPRPGSVLLSYDYADFYLYDPNNDKEYKYGVFEHYYLLKQPDEMLLEPEDSVYYYTILAWEGNSGFTFLKYDDLRPGYYKIRSTYLSLVSNVDSFYGTTLPANEKAVFERVGAIVDTFWSWPEGGWPPMRDKIRNILPEIIAKEQSVFTPFCHYMLWRMNFANEAKAKSLADEFFERYPNSPLAEKLAFDLFRYYGWYKNDYYKGESLVLDALNKYPDNLVGYFYLGLKNKEGRLK